MARKVSGKKPEGNKTNRESGAKTTDGQKLQSWLDASGSLFEPDFGQDDPAGPKIHRPVSVPHVSDVGQHDNPVDDETFDRKIDPFSKHVVDVLQGMYGKGGEGLRNYTTPTDRAKGPLINVPLPGARNPMVINTPPPTRDLGPLINVGQSGGPSGPLINVPLPGLPKGPLINVAPGAFTGTLAKAALLKLKAQQQAKAHGYAHLVA